MVANVQPRVTGGSSCFGFAPENFRQYPYNQLMIIPDRNITLAELRRNNGDPGRRKFVAYQGIVYDVTECPRWRQELHELQHFPGQDLTAELKEAPHKADVFTRPCVQVVGILIQSSD